MKENILKHIGNILKGLLIYVKEKHSESWNDHELSIGCELSFGMSFGNFVCVEFKLICLLNFESYLLS